MKLNFYKIFIVVCFLQINVQKIYASHSMGADLTYRCLGGNTYELTLSFYRDCKGIYPSDSAQIFLSSSCFPTDSVMLPQIPGTGQEITPICPTEVTTCNGGIFPGIQEYIYRGIVTLQGQCTDWSFNYNLCCRNAAITNINNPGGTLMYIYATLNNTITPCNNSPTFSNKPVPFACLGQQFCYNHGAYDVDGDSLAYTLITPYDSPGLPVTYNPPFSATNPLTSNPAMTFNPMTGDICMTPTNLEITIMAVLVQEFRNGVLIGSVERDIQVTVINCNNQLPSLTGMNGTNIFSTTICAGVQTCFTIYSNDPDTNQHTFVTWDFSIPAGTFTVIPGSRESAVFCWTPTLADISPNPYCFTVTVHDDNCPYVGSQIYSYCITVAGISVNAGTDLSVGCNSYATLTASASGGSGIYTYLWNNGATTPSITSGPGTYIVTASDGTCSYKDTALIIPGSGVPNANFSPFNSCLGTTIQFHDLSTISSGTIINWHWNFGDGDTSNVQNPLHIYASTGNYQVLFIVESAGGCIDSIIRTLTISNNQPTGAFVFNNVCLGSIINFTDQSVSASTITNWWWNFGDSLTSTVQSPAHTYSFAGSHTVSLVLTNSSGCTDSIAHTVNVFPLPTANAGTDTAICSGHSVTLTATGGNAYSWTPGGAITAAMTVTPAATQTYTVLVTDANDCNARDSVTVAVNPNPVANAGNDFSICLGNSATLNASGGGSYSWNPGGATTQQINVSPVISMNYIVTVTNNFGCTSTDNALVTVNPLPVANAGVDQSICIGNSALLSASGASNYLWNPGGATTQQISISPVSSTTYAVTVTDNNGCHSDDQVNVTVNPLPAANAGPDQAICLGHSATLAASGGVSYLWNPNGSTTQQISVNPIVNTNFTVTVTDNNGCQATDQVTVTVNPLPIADAGLDQVICSGNIATLSATGGGNYLWNPGGATTQQINVSPATTTNYSVTVTNNNGCQLSDSALVTVNALPVANAGTDQSICFGNNVTLNATGGGNYLWQPTGDSTSSITITPSSTTTFLLTVTNAAGCHDTDHVTVTVNPLPVASFTSPALICEGTTIQFSDLSFISSGTLSAWNWNFGNNTTSLLQNPTVSYADTGNYSVTLVVTTNAGCKDTSNVTVAVASVPVATFAANDVCLHHNVNFNNNTAIASGEPLNYQWSFGDSLTSALTNPSHYYSNYGSYTATLIAISGRGCRDTTSSTITIHPLPVASFNSASTCENSPVQFNDLSSIPLGTINSWSWNFGDSSGSTMHYPLHIYSPPGIYQVQLNVASNFGCTDNVFHTQRIFPLPIPDFNGDSKCLGEEIQFDNLSTIPNGSITQWQWGFGDNTGSYSFSPVHLYNQPGFYNVQLTAISDSGCIASVILPSAAIIFPLPQAAFSPNTTEVEAIFPYVIFSNQSTNPASYQWNFGDGTLSSDFAPNHVFPHDGIFDIQLIVIDQNGCRDTANSKIEVKPVVSIFIPNAFTPNGDGVNDNFHPSFVNIVSIDMQIFDRWGKKIAEWSDLKGSWNGMYDGNQSQADVYVYRLEFTDIFLKQDVRIGHVTLVR